MTPQQQPVPTRIRMDLAYDGTGYSGWARQPGLRTLQQDVEDALGEIVGQQVEVVCAGRTDAGVHARGQVVHADIPPHSLQRRTWYGFAAQFNRITDDRLLCRRIGAAPPGFDARFAALARHYTYRLLDGPENADPLTRTWVQRNSRRLDEAAMAKAASELLGEHDFAAFCRSREGATTVREVLYLRIDRPSAGLVEVSIGADAFCHSMVRCVVGALVAVGEGRRDPRWVGDVLRGARRDSAARVMPAAGLVLERVDYPPDELLAQRVLRTRRVRVLESRDTRPGPPTA